MNGQTFELLRGPVAIVLVLLALIVLWPRGADGEQVAVAATPTPAIVVGEPDGAVLSAPSPNFAPTPPPSPVPTLAPTAVPTPIVTPRPVPDTFAARVMACRDIDGSRCRGELDEFPRRARSFTALVVFEDARAGDTISVTLTGPGVIINGGPYTLGGGGDGYYYSRINYGEVPDGDYVLIALRNGVEVARANLRND